MITRSAVVRISGFIFHTQYTDQVPERHLLTRSINAALVR